ncbi:MAG: M48 family metalloprotease [Nitratireductor sp.]
MATHSASNADRYMPARKPQMSWLARGCGLALLLALQGCVLGDLGVNDSSPSLSSSFVRPDDPQEALGAREHPLVLAKYGGEYRNEEAEKVVALVVGRLISVSDDPSRVFKITILNTPKVNAFALPGGYLYVTRGLLALANDSAELAAVIAHEMAHVSANHAILRQEKLSSSKVGEEVVHEVLGNSVAAKVALASNKLKLADFSREQELQADAVGIRMTGNAGFDPYAASRFLETMQAYQAYKAGNSDPFDDVTFLSSHPTTPQRVDLAKRHARFFGAPGIGEQGRERYLKGIDGLLYGDTADEGYVRGRVFSHVGLGITFTVPEGSRIDNQPKAIIISGPGDVATRFDAAVLSRRQGLGDYLKSGWINGLIESSIVETQTPSGLNMAIAEARAENWHFRITVVQIDSQVYRFITAAPVGATQLPMVSQQITSTFRKMTPSEQAALAPLRIRIIKVGANDTVGTLAARMKSGDDALKLFRLINGLTPGENPQPGTSVKIISDE